MTDIEEDIFNEIFNVVCTACKERPEYTSAECHLHFDRCVAMYTEQARRINTNVIEARFGDDLK